MGAHDQQCLFGWAWRKREMTEFVDQKSTGGALRPTLNPDPHDEKATMHPLKVFFSNHRSDATFEQRHCRS